MFSESHASALRWGRANREPENTRPGWGLRRVAGWMAVGLVTVLVGGATGCRAPGGVGSVDWRGGTWLAHSREAETELRIRGYAHYGAGVAKDLRGDSAGALAHYVEAALADPQNESLVLQTFGRLVQGEQPDRAARLMEQCVRIPRAPASYFVSLAIARALEGDWVAAIAANRAALDRHPSFLIAYQNLVAIHTELGEPEAVLEVIRDASRQTTLDPGYLAAVAEMFTAHARRHPESSEALRGDILRTLDWALALEPDEPWVVEALAGGYKRLGELGRAEALYREALRRRPGEGLVRQNLLELYLRTGNREGAAELLEGLLRDDPANQSAHYILGSLAFQDGRLEEARDHLQRSRLLAPGWEPAYYELAAVHLSLGDHAAALEVLEAAEARFPGGSFVGEFYRGLAHMGAEEWEEATRRFTAAEILALADRPQRLTHLFYFQFGAASERRGDYEAAEQRLRRCLELAPDFAPAQNYLGYMWAERGENLEEARELIERAVAQEPDNAAYLDSLGWVWFRLGHPDRALPWLKAAIEKSEEPDSVLYDHLGDVYWALGREEEARRAWRRAWELEPDEELAQKLERP